VPEVWHNPSPFTETDENRLAAASPAPGSVAVDKSAATASLPFFTSLQPDGDRSHSGTPGRSAAGGSEDLPKRFQYSKRSLWYGQPSLRDNDTAESSTSFQDEYAEANSYIETADASVYPEVCYYPVTEGPRPVE